MRYKSNDPKLKSYRQKLRNNMTEAETMLWERIRDGKILNYKFRRQHSIGRFVLDFYCPKLKLGIEVDGGQHADKKIEKYDDDRTSYLKKYGIKILRYWNDEVLENIEGVYLEILNTINGFSK